VLKDGELQQVDTPQNLFDHPGNLFVAGFIGSPAMNFVQAKLVRDDGPAITFAEYRLPLREDAIARFQGLDSYFGREVIVGIRPSSFEDAAFAPKDDGWASLPVQVDVTEELGSEVNLIFTVNAPPVQHEVMIARFDKTTQDTTEAETAVVGENQSSWTARVNPRTRARIGEKLELAVDPYGLHFFDVDSGQAVPRTAERD
jgi:multiple sugar transport system ATP-binding protein